MLQAWACGLRLGLRGRLFAVVAMLATLSKHLLKLLLLRVGQDGFDLGVRVLHDGVRLGVAILFAERGVGAQSLHLLLASGEDGRDLRHLIAAQAEPLTETRSELAGIEVAMLIARLRRRGLRRSCGRCLGRCLV
jgi:hypothetical protein